MQLKLRSKLDSPDAIEDVKQESFVRVLTLITSGKVRQPDRLGACVNSVCNNVLREYYRGSGRNISMSGDGEGEDDSTFPRTTRRPRQCDYESGKEESS